MRHVQWHREILTASSRVRPREPRGGAATGCDVVGAPAARGPHFDDDVLFATRAPRRSVPADEMY